MRGKQHLQEVPTRDLLAEELGELLRAGLGRSREGLTEANVRRLSELSAELVDDPSEPWLLRIARAVAIEIDQIPEESLRLAIADMFGLELEGRSVDEVIKGIESGEEVAALEGHGGRYRQAGERFRGPRRPTGYSESTIKNRRRRAWLNVISGQMLDRYSQSQSSSSEFNPLPVAPSTGLQPAEAPENKPPTFLIGLVGAVLLAVGVAWLAAVVIGAIG